MKYKSHNAVVYNQALSSKKKIITAKVSQLLEKTGNALYKHHPIKIPTDEKSHVFTVPNNVKVFEAKWSVRKLPDLEPDQALELIVKLKKEKNLVVNGRHFLISKTDCNLNVHEFTTVPLETRLRVIRDTVLPKIPGSPIPGADMNALVATEKELQRYEHMLKPKFPVTGKKL